MALLVAATQVAPGTHLRPNDTVQDLLNHPAFAGFARLLLPWDDRTYDSRLPLRNLGTLLPYHTHVNTATVLGALNHMIDDVNGGRAVFYDFYTQQEKADDPTKSNTALFFFRGTPGAPFAVVAPGGGLRGSGHGDSLRYPCAVIRW